MAKNEKKHKLKPLAIILLISGLICILFFYKTYSLEIIPNEDAESKKLLQDAILTSKLDTDDGIKNLKALNNLEAYTDYKRNYILAKLYEKKEEYNKAITIYENISNKNYPLKERVLFHLANLHTKQGNDKLALKYFNKLLRDFPYSKTVPQAKYYLAQTLFRLKLTNQAVETLLSLKSESPKTQFGIATNYYLGENEYNKKNYDIALNYFREYLKLSPDGRFANNIAELIKDKNKFNLKPNDYLLLGNVFFHNKDYKNAAFHYKISNNPKKYYELGYSLFRTNNKSEAIPYLKEFAKTFPKSKNARLALYYAGTCTPSYLRSSFFRKATKDIPELAYYTIYKEALEEDSLSKKEKILMNLLSIYPNSEFTLEAVWEIMWQKIKDKKYNQATEIGEKYFGLSKDTINAKSETRAKIGFWLGKIAEYQNEKSKAIEFYNETKDLFFDNYYSFRAKNRLDELLGKGKKDNFWEIQSNASEFKDYNWVIPIITKKDNLKNHFGAAVVELIDIQEYNEAIDLIGKSKFPSKQITAWLKTLNSEYEASINLANLILNQYNLDEKNKLWEIAYPLHFWQLIKNNSQRYKNVDPFLVCGVIRQESRFETNAISISDARGLMQLITPTANSVARQLKIYLNSQDDLYNPKVNIPLGIHYLSGLLSDFNNPLFAVASYNAGPQAINRWLSRFKGKDLDFFIEEIPYEQTRTYVKKVFSSYWTYLKIYKDI